jgi:hypothetical protein
MLGDLIVQPEWIRQSGHRLYRVVIGAVLYFFYVNPAAVSRELLPALVSKDGTWRLLTGEVDKIPCLNQWLTAFAEAEKMRG